MRYLPLFSSSLFLAITLAGCGDGGTGSTGTGGGPGTSTSTGSSTTGTGGSSTGTGGSSTSTSTSTSTGTGGPASDVTGTIVDTYITETGDVTQVNTAVTLVALAPAGSGFTMIPGTVAADGSFTIPDVPAGTFYLGLQSGGQISNFVVTDQRTLDLGRVYAGRPDTTPITTTPTSLVLNLTGMNPWQDTDALEIFSHGAGAGSDLLSAAMAFPTAGDTSLKALPVDALQFFVPGQIEAAKGDTTFFTQLVSRTDGAFSYSSIGKSFKPAAFSLLDGQTTPVSGAFTDVPQQTVTLDWKRSLFAGLSAAVNPGAKLTSCDVYGFGEPGGATRVTNTYSPTILYGGDPAVDDVMLKLSYGNPFPASWAAMGFVSARFSVSYLVPGTATTKNAHATVDVSGTITDLAGGAVKPILGPPSALQIGGKDANAVNTGVGLSPVLSWSVPAVGTSAIYQVSVRKVDPNISAGSGAGRFITQGTSITLPPGVLESGSSYFVRVTALSAGSVTSPYKALPGATATAISGVFTP
jgi:hypothetical protein